MSGLPQPQLHKDAKYIFLSDWVSSAAMLASAAGAAALERVRSSGNTAGALDTLLPRRWG